MISFFFAQFRSLGQNSSGAVRPLGQDEVTNFGRAVPNADRDVFRQLDAELNDQRREMLQATIQALQAAPRDPSVTEAFAFLLDGLLRERGWLKRFVGIGQPREVLRFTAFHKLWFLRRYAAKLEYELLLHTEGPGPRSREAYRDLLSDATLVAWPAELFLFDVDAFFYAARYLRAWIFEARLREFLRERFDEEWYRNDRSGPFLLGLWRQGQYLTTEELAADLGFGPPSVDPLIAQIAADLA